MPDLEVLQRSVPRDAFTVPHVDGWRAEIQEPYDDGKLAATWMAQVLEDESHHVSILAGSVMAIADVAGCGDEIAETLLTDVRSLLAEKA
jgi:hypothetical protein